MLLMLQRSVSRPNQDQDSCHVSGVTWALLTSVVEGPALIGC